MITGKPQRVYQSIKTLNCALPLSTQERQGKEAKCNTVCSLSSGGQNTTLQSHKKTAGFLKYLLRAELPKCF